MTTFPREHAGWLLSLAIAAGLGLGACSTTPSAATATDTAMAVPEIRPGVPAGYLAKGDGPDSQALVPPPPAPGSPAFANDEAVNRAAYALKDTPRWRQAIEDANLSFPRAAGTFSCALGAPINERDTPHLYRLLRRSFVDAAVSTDAAKRTYQRARPFMRNGQPSCTPDEEADLRRNGSYPSGHTAIGWGWALVLAEVAPERGDALLARGRSFGESRLVCNVHWQSDVLEGRFMAAGAVARLHGEAVFRQDVQLAREELAGVRAKGLAPDRDCAAEAAALALKIPGVL